MARRKRAAERVLKAERTHHLGYPAGGERGPAGNAGNGFPPQSLLTESGAIALEIPRDRDGSFTPQFVPKGARRLPGFDEPVLMLYAGGLSTRELQAFLVKRYQIPVSPNLIAQTEGAAFWHRVFREWQGRGVTDIVIALIDGLSGSRTHGRRSFRTR